MIYLLTCCIPTSHLYSLRDCYCLSLFSCLFKQRNLISNVCQHRKMRLQRENLKRIGNNSANIPSPIGSSSSGGFRYQGRTFQGKRSLVWYKFHACLTYFIIFMQIRLPILHRWVEGEVGLESKLSHFFLFHLSSAFHLESNLASYELSPRVTCNYHRNIVYISGTHCWFSMVR